MMTKKSVQITIGLACITCLIFIGIFYLIRSQNKELKIGIEQSFKDLRMPSYCSLSNKRLNDGGVNSELQLHASYRCDNSYAQTWQDISMQQINSEPYQAENYIRAKPYIFAFVESASTRIDNFDSKLIQPDTRPIYIHVLIGS